MVFEFYEKINTFSESINFQLLFITLLFMIIGFIYFILRLRNVSHPINVEENNYYNNINNQSSEQDNNQRNNINNNNIDNNSRTYHIEVQIGSNRHHFDIRNTDSIGQFVREKIYPLTNNRQVYLFYQGQLLNQNQQFSLYEHRFSDNMVIICQIRENAYRNNLNNNHYNDNFEEMNQYQLRNDPRAVSIYSIYTHICIIIILGFIIFSYKTFKEIFTKQTILMTQVLCIIWAISFSNTITKLFFYKKISY